MSGLTYSPILPTIQPPVITGQWANVTPHFRLFLDNLEPTPLQFMDIDTKVQGVTNCLYNEYYPSQLLPVKNYYLIVGSVGKKCAVRPLSDVDILFQLPEKDYNRFREYSSNGQSAMLQEVKGSLSRTYPDTNIRGDGQVAVVPFLTLKVEVVPVFYINQTIIVPDTHKGGYWNTSDPNTEAKDLDSADTASNGKARHLIKMLKAWKSACNVPIKSIVLERAAIGFCSGWQYRSQTIFWYDWMVRDFFVYLFNSQNVSIQLPGSHDTLNTGNDWASRCETAYQRALKACEYEQYNSDNPLLASSEWKKLFGDVFQHLRY